MGIKRLFFRINAVAALSLAALTFSLLLGPSWSEAAASDLFFDDFEDMASNRWHAGGDGVVEVDTFSGNQALRMTKRGYAIAAVRIDGEFAVKIEVMLAASSLEAQDHCVAEASADGGAIWEDVLRLKDGEDDGESWYSGEVELMLPGPRSTLAIRLRSEGDSNSDICWADEVRVSIHDAMTP